MLLYLVKKKNIDNVKYNYTLTAAFLLSLLINSLYNMYILQAIMSVLWKQIFKVLAPSFIQCVYIASLL